MWDQGLISWSRTVALYGDRGSKLVSSGGAVWKKGSVSRSQAEVLCGNRGQ